jgi:Methylase involved in ubiquinone/menaquinone biosynthesis
MDEITAIENAVSSEELDLYGDSAEFYDLMYSQAMANGSKERSARRYLEEGDKVLDLACGTGIVTERLEDDFDVTGVDISSEVLEVAKHKDLDSELIQGDMTDLPFYREFDAVIMYGQPLSHLESPEQVRSAANEIYDALNSNGFLITDVFKPEAGKKDDITPIEVERPEDYVISMFPDFTDYNSESNSWTGSITFSIQNGPYTNISRDSRSFRGYSFSELENIMLDAGFDGVENERIFENNLSQGIVAYKGSKPEAQDSLGFFL